MKEFGNLINKSLEKIESENSLIQIVSHLDCDGLASASILASALIQNDKSFQITVVKRINPKIIETLKKREPKMVIFTDIGSGYLDVLKELDCNLIILDHHEIEGSSSEKMIHLNPLNFGLKLSGSGITYALVRDIFKNNSLAPLAIVGTLGDVSYPTDSKLFETSLIKVENGLNLFGRISRPLYKSLKYSGIPGINEESKAIQFLSEIGIEAQNNGEWRTLNNLNGIEKKRLADALIKEGLKYENFNEKDIFGNVLTLKGFPEELKDPNEFATILNACANMNESATGIALCLGSKKALKDAKGIVRGYKRLIGNYMRWVENNPKKLKRTEFANYLLAGSNINENLIGTIVSMLFKESEKTLFGFSNAEDGIKISVRSKTVNIREIVYKAAKECGGRGGGHKNAAGATIPEGTQDKFIDICEKLLKEKNVEE